MKRRNYQKFSEDFKRKVSLEVLQGKWNKETARRIYGINGKSLIGDWIRFYSIVEGISTNGDVPLEAMTTQERAQIEQLKRKIAELEKLLSNETHRVGLYKTMIEIAEEQLNIPIRKKYGAKQFKPTKSARKQ